MIPYLSCYCGFGENLGRRNIGRRVLSSIGGGEQVSTRRGKNLYTIYNGHGISATITANGGRELAVEQGVPNAGCLLVCMTLIKMELELDIWLTCVIRPEPMPSRPG